MWNKKLPLLVLLYFFTITTQTSFALEVGDMARDFALKDVNGHIQTLGDHMENAEITVLYLISIYCDACKKKIPSMNKDFSTYRERGVRFIAVALENDHREVENFSKEHAIDFPLLPDPDKITYYLYGVNKVPQLFIIDRSGIIKYRGTGKASVDIGKNVELLLKDVGGKLHEGDEAPEFRLPSVDGRTVTVRYGTNHHTTMIAFFSSDDNPDQELAQSLTRFYNKNQSSNISIVGIASRSFMENAAGFAKLNSIPFPVLMDKEGIVFKQYSVTKAPEIVMVNESGRVRKRTHQRSYRDLVKLGMPEEEPVRIMTEKQLVELIKRAFPDSESIERYDMDDEIIFISSLGKQKKYIARFVEKDTLCDVCSDVYFFYTIDMAGIYRKIVLITPFEFYGTPIDATDFVNQFLGKSFHHPFVAGTNVDVISGATKSCLKLIEGLNETEALFYGYTDDPSFDAPFRKKMCFKEQGELEWLVHRHQKTRGATQVLVDLKDITPDHPKKKLPLCPSGGLYKTIFFNGIVRVMCTVHGLDPQSATYSLE